MGGFKLSSTTGMLVNINSVHLPEKSALCSSSEGCSAKRLRISFSLNDCKKTPIHTLLTPAAGFSLPHNPNTKLLFKEKETSERF